MEILHSQCNCLLLLICMSDDGGGAKHMFMRKLDSFCTDFGVNYRDGFDKDK